MKRKVLHVINSLGTGGAEMLLANSLSPGGLQEHLDNTVIYFTGTSPIEQRIDKNVPVYSLNYNGWVNFPNVLLKLRKFIQKHKIDLVHSHLNPAGLYTDFICPSEVPHVHTLHTTYSMDTGTRSWILFLEKHFHFSKKNSNIILLSEYTRNDFIQNTRFRGKTFVLNNFVDDSFFKDIKKHYEKRKPLKLVAAGVLLELKNFEYLLSVFTYLKDLDISLDIYGDGDLEKYQEVIRKENINVSMKGHIDDMAVVLPGYDLFVMPSKVEGFPLALFEAMASGLPVMVSNIPPLKSIIRENGIYFELNDAEATANIIRAIYNSDIDINELGVKGRSFAEKTVRRRLYCERLLDIYNNIWSSGSTHILTVFLAGIGA